MSQAVSAGRLLVVGELCVDVIVPLSGSIEFQQTEQLVESTDLVLGSSSAITACGAAGLGIETQLASVGGDDAFGRFATDELRRFGVGQDFIDVRPGVATGSSLHLTRPDGDRAILTAMGSIGMTSVDHAPAAALKDFSHIHIGSWFLQRALWDGALALFATAREQRLTTSLDGNFDPDRQWDRGIVSLLSETDVFFANDQELTGIASITDPEAAARALLARMPTGAVIVRKLGADGAMAIQLAGDDLIGWRASTPAVPGELVDTVGAGDNLAAGFLAARLRGATIADALRIGVVCGTASTRSVGGTAAHTSWETASAIADAVPVAAFGGAS